MWLKYFKFGGNNLKVVHAVGFISLVFKTKLSYIDNEVLDWRFLTE